MKSMLLIPALLFFFSGCAVPLAVWQTHKFTDAQQRSAYSQYMTEMEKLNYDRQKQGLAPQAIMSYEQWKTGCPASPASSAASARPAARQVQASAPGKSAQAQAMDSEQGWLNPQAKTAD